MSILMSKLYGNSSLTRFFSLCLLCILIVANDFLCFVLLCSKSNSQLEQLASIWLSVSYFFQFGTDVVKSLLFNQLQTLVGECLLTGVFTRRTCTVYRAQIIAIAQKHVLYSMYSTVIDVVLSVICCVLILDQNPDNLHYLDAEAIEHCYGRY